MHDLNKLHEAIQPYYCSDKIRIGSMYDGGYVLSQSAVLDADILLSFGIATNIDFETHFARINKTAAIMMFDPFTGPAEDFRRLLRKPFTVTEVEERIPPPIINPGYKIKVKSMPVRIIERLFFWTRFYGLLLQKRYIFKKSGLREYCNDRFINFPALFELPGLAQKTHIAIKMDIECDEYRVWKQLLPFLTNVSVIVMEVHQAGIFVKDVIDMIKEFKARGLHIIHVHGNNVDHLIDGSLIPNCLEITFCKEQYCAPLTPDHRYYPDPALDAPCNPRWKDYEMPGIDRGAV